MTPDTQVRLSDSALARIRDDLIREAMALLRGRVVRVFQAGCVVVAWGAGPTVRCEVASDVAEVQQDSPNETEGTMT